jgi:hypothetical protein
MKKKLLVFSLISLLVSCSQKPSADLLVYNATIYTVDSLFSKAEAMLVKDGRILAVGKKAELESTYEIKEKMNAWFIPGHLKMSIASIKLRDTFRVQLQIKASRAR